MNRKLGLVKIIVRAEFYFSMFCRFGDKRVTSFVTDGQTDRLVSRQDNHGKKKKNVKILKNKKVKFCHGCKALALYLFHSDAKAKTYGWSNNLQGRTECICEVNLGRKGSLRPWHNKHNPVASNRMNTDNLEPRVSISPLDCSNRRIQESMIFVPLQLTKSCLSTKVLSRSSC